MMVFGIVFSVNYFLLMMRELHLQMLNHPMVVMSLLERSLGTSDVVAMTSDVASPDIIDSVGIALQVLSGPCKSLGNTTSSKGTSLVLLTFKEVLVGHVSMSLDDMCGIFM